MPISEELRQIYAGTNTTKKYIETLEFSHSAFSVVDGSKSRFLVNDFDEWQFRLDKTSATTQTFKALPFMVKLPKQDDGGLHEFSVSLANPGRPLMSDLESALTASNEGIACIYRVYLDTLGSFPELDPPIRSTITDVVATLNDVTITATRFNVLGRQFPSEVYSVNKFPGLLR